MQVEYYFGDVNYPIDQHLHDCEDPQGYIYIEEILGWNMMRRRNATL